MADNNKKGQEITEGLLDFLSETGQKNLLPEVYEELSEKVDKKGKKKEVIVSSAVKLSDKELKKIKEVVKKKFKEDYPVKEIINKALLAGFTVKMGDWYVDASVRQDLKNLKNTLQSA